VRPGRPLQALELPPPAHGTVTSSLAVTFFWFRPSNTALTRYSKSRFLQIPVAPLGEAPYRRWGKIMENLVIWCDLPTDRNIRNHFGGASSCKYVVVERVGPVGSGWTILNLGLQRTAPVTPPCTLQLHLSTCHANIAQWSLAAKLPTTLCQG